MKRFLAAFAVAVLAVSGAAHAELQMTSGIRYVAPNEPLASCNSKAQEALSAYLSNVAETAPNSGVWTANGPQGTTANTATAVVRCVPYQKGYSAMFVCAIQAPPNPYTAEILCLDVAHKFNGEQVYPLPTPTPPPSGCTTTNLLGTWTNDNDPSKVIKMTVDGGLTDQDGVSGNWALNGDKASIAYYGLHTLTLSKDGKHLSGDLHLTRKC